MTKPSVAGRRTVRSCGTHGHSRYNTNNKQASMSVKDGALVTADSSSRDRAAHSLRTSNSPIQPGELDSNEFVETNPRIGARARNTGVCVIGFQPRFSYIESANSPKTIFDVGSSLMRPKLWFARTTAPPHHPGPASRKQQETGDRR